MGKRNGVKVARWTDASGSNHEHRFEEGHPDSERKDFLRSLLGDGTRVAPGTTVTVADAPKATNKRKTTKARKR